MSDFSNIFDQNSNPEKPMNTLTSNTDQIQALDAEILNNNNNDLINLEQTPEIKETTPIKKESNKSNENEPLTFHESSEVIQIPISDIDIDSKEFQNTLDEAIITTILRDLSLIYTKLKFVVIPYG